MSSKTQGWCKKSSRPFISTRPAAMSCSRFLAASACLADDSASLQEPQQTQRCFVTNKKNKHISWGWLSTMIQIFEIWILFFFFSSDSKSILQLHRKSCWKFKTRVLRSYNLLVSGGRDDRWYLLALPREKLISRNRDLRSLIAALTNLSIFFCSHSFLSFDLFYFRRLRENIVFQTTAYCPATLGFPV